MLTAGSGSGFGSGEVRLSCLISLDLVLRVGFEVEPLQGTITVFAIDGHRSVVAAAMLCHSSS